VTWRQGTVHWKSFTRPNWHARAACRGCDPVLFYPTRGDEGQVLAEAKKICAGCPVRAECLDWALVNSELHGVWGGVSERSRRTMRRGLRLAGPEV
jgi:WhiB family transcriptional regulator, redox-sensing transcriptional regulator